MGEQLAIGPGEPESKQCVLLAVVAAALWYRSKKHHPPSFDEVQAEALKARAEKLQHALDESHNLGDAPPMDTPAEGNLRVFAHDALHAHHDKDIRSLATFPLSILQGLTQFPMIFRHIRPCGNG